MRFRNWVMGLLLGAAAAGVFIIAALAQVAEVQVGGLNVRSGPGTSYAIRGTMPQGSQAKIIETQGDWLYVVTGPMEGWVYGPYVRILNGTPGASAPETVLVCQGVNRTTARVYRQNGQLMLRVHDRQQAVTWLDTPAQRQVGAEVAAYLNIRGEQTTRVLHSLNSPTNCSIQTNDQPLEPGTVTQLEQPSS